MSLPHYAIHRDGHVETGADLDPRVRALLQKISRSAYMIQMHREGIALNQRRIAEAQAELERMEGGR